MKDTDNASDWLAGGAPVVGGRIFGDRDATFTAVPETLADAESILTACDSKNITDPTDMATFTTAVDSDVTVYIALDSRVEKVPSWMGGFTKTGEVLTASNDVTFELYAAPFAPGTQVTLGSNEQSYQCMNYIVFLAETPAAPTEPDTEP